MAADQSSWEYSRAAGAGTPPRALERTKAEKPPSVSPAKYSPARSVASDNMPSPNRARYIEKIESVSIKADNLEFTIKDLRESFDSNLALLQEFSKKGISYSMYRDLIRGVYRIYFPKMLLSSPNSVLQESVKSLPKRFLKNVKEKVTFKNALNMGSIKRVIEKVPNAEKLILDHIHN
jgi:hypothetical protein